MATWIGQRSPGSSRRAVRRNQNPVMPDLINALLADIQSADAPHQQEALSQIALLFEKWRLGGNRLSRAEQRQQGWTEAVIGADVSEAEVAVLRDAVTAF